MAAKLTGVSTPAQIATGFLLINLNLAPVSRPQITGIKKPQLFAYSFELFRFRWGFLCCFGYAAVGRPRRAVVLHGCTLAELFGSLEALTR
jgi:hypothetical protein